MRSYMKKPVGMLKFKKAADVGLTYALLILVGIIFVFPCLWLVLASFSKTGSLYSFDGFFPPDYSLDSFKTLFTDTAMYNYPQWFLAYTISRFEFKARKPLMKITLVLGMFPSFMGMTAVYILMTQFNMINNHWGLILIYSAGAPMGYLVQKGFFDTIPNSIYEAARIDGATNARVFCKITLPLSKPIIVYTALTSFAWPWSDFILPKLLLKERDMYTTAVGLMSLPETEFARFAAGAIFIAVPIVVLYFCLIKYMINGMTAGAVKQ